MKRSRFKICLYLCAICAAYRFAPSCRQADEPASAPLPVAYPRVAVLPDSMVTHSAFGVDVDVNAAAIVTDVPGKTPGIIVDYPGLNAKVYYTYIPTRGTDPADIINARKERISLNLNGVPARTLHSPQGVLVIARSISSTPVQLLALEGNNVVSATAFLSNPGTSFDSISPLIDMLTRDMSRTLPNVDFK